MESSVNRSGSQKILENSAFMITSSAELKSSSVYQSVSLNNSADKVLSSTRECSYEDWLANLFGIVFVTLFVYLVNSKQESKIELFEEKFDLENKLTNTVNKLKKNVFVESQEYDYIPEQKYEETL